MNKYLEKVALRRIISEIAKGNVTTPIKTLAQQGFIKSKGVYAKGMNEGNKSIASSIPNLQTSRARTTADLQRTAQGGGFVTLMKPGGGIQTMHSGRRADIHNLPGSENMRDVGTPAFNRHELFEAADARALEAKHALPTVRRSNITKAYVGGLKSQGLPDADIKEGRQQVLGFMKNLKVALPSMFKDSGGNVVGAHLSPRVLSRESEMIRKNPYLKHLRDHRESSGEASIIGGITGKRFGVDKMTGKDHHRAFTAKPADYSEQYGVKAPVFEAN